MRLRDLLAEALCGSPALACGIDSEAVPADDFGCALLDMQCLLAAMGKGEPTGLGGTAWCVMQASRCGSHRAVQSRDSACAPWVPPLPVLDHPTRKRVYRGGAQGQWQPYGRCNPSPPFAFPRHGSNVRCCCTCCRNPPTPPVHLHCPRACPPPLPSPAGGCTPSWCSPDSLWPAAARCRPPPR
jgi:hypothetical protein